MQQGCWLAIRFGDILLTPLDDSYIPCISFHCPQDISYQYEDLEAGVRCGTAGIDGVSSPLDV